MKDEEGKKHEIVVGFSLWLDEEAYEFAKQLAEVEGKTVEEFVADRLAGAVDKAKIAELREYITEGEMFLEAGALNNHGLKLSPRDRANFILKARKEKLPPEVIARTLGMDPKKFKEFIEKRSAKT
jgi:restriction endonuclease Mrr